MSFLILRGYHLLLYKIIMMKKYSFLLLLTLFVSQMMAQNVPSYVPTNGLVGWWPFNGNANDESGNGNNGTVNGATLTADRDGKANSAYSFGGINQWIDVQSNQNLNLKGEITISAWIFKSEFFKRYEAIIIKDQNGTNTQNINYKFQLSKSNALDFYTSRGYSATKFDSVKWNFFVGINTKDTIKLYLNNILVFKSSNQFNNNDLTNNLLALSFGRLPYNELSEPGNERMYFNGKLDDIAIYNRALTQEEITKLYNGNLCPPLALNLTQPTCFVKTGQVDISSPKGTGFSYSIDGTNFKTDTIFPLLKPGTYNVSVKHTSGCTNTNSFTINAIPTSLTATTTPAGSLKICEGSSIKLAANTGKNYTYQWFKDKVAIQGATVSTYEAKKAGKYTVFVNDGQCRDTSDVVTIDTIPLPLAPKINNSYIQACNMLPKEEIARQNQIDLNYRWYRSEIGNDSLQKYEPLYPGFGQYFLSQFSNTNPVCESKKRTMIQVEMIMPGNINYPSTTTFCQGDSLKLEAYLNGNLYDYVWMKDNNLILGTDGKTSIMVKETGNYAVSNRRCMNQGGMTSVYITFNPLPDVKITYTGAPILPVGGSLSLKVTDKQDNKYEWFKNGTLIQGATTNNYLAKEIGKYSVKVTNGNCSASSSPVEITGSTDSKPMLLNTGKKSFCQGDSTTLKVDAVNAVFEWLKDGKTITEAVGSSIVVRQTGIYSVKVTKNTVVQITDTLHITVFENPKVDIKDISTNIQQEFPMYVFKNQKPIQLLGMPSDGKFSGQGITNTVFNPSTLSLGKKVITYSFSSIQGCKGSVSRSTIVVDSIGNVCSVTKYDTVIVKDTVSITNNVTKYDTVIVKNNVYDTILKLKFKLTTGIKANQMTSMTLYPNPTTDMLFIEAGDANALDGYRYHILDAVGKEVYNQLVKNIKTEIPLKSLGTAGMYLFEVIDQQNKTIQSSKIVLE